MEQERTTDRLEEVLTALETRAEVIAPAEPGTMDLISFAEFDTMNAHALRTFQRAIESRFDIPLRVVGGYTGCARIRFELIATNPNEASAALRRLVEHPLFQTMARALEFRIAVINEPYHREDLSVKDGAPGFDGVQLFYSYAHEDRKSKNELLKHLQALRVLGLVRDWHDGLIPPGADWDKFIRRELEASHLILLLISADFLNSRYIDGLEMQCAMRMRDADAAAVVPLLVRDAYWQVPALAALQVLPRDGKPVAPRRNRDKAWTEVCVELEAVARSLISRKQQAG